MTRADFETLLRPVVDSIQDRRLDFALEQGLNDAFAVGNAYCRSVLERATKAMPKAGSVSGKPAASDMDGF